MRALIVDDERLARNELRRLLAAFPALSVVGEARSADEAASMLTSLRPDLLFLDIQMPGRNVFEWLASLDRAPQVIFTTAYDQYAVRAFEVNALDYLLKPVEADRLRRAIQKVLSNSPEKLPETDRLTQNDQVFVRDGARCWFVKLADLRLLESEGNYTRLYFNDSRPLISRSLNHLAARLDPRTFFRVSRKRIVNLHWIDLIEPSVSGGLILQLKGGPAVEVSRRQSQAFKEWKCL
jgi:two-component system LytT family response regulator